MTTPMYWLLGVAVMAAVTYVPRVVPLTLMRRRVGSRFWRSFLHYMPYAALGAMTFPALLDATASPISAVAGMAAALVTAWLGFSLLPVAATATAVVFVVERLLGLPFFG